MKNFIISVLSLSFLISCSSGGVGGNDFIEPYNTIITSQPYYYKSVNVENSECKSIKKLIFDDDGSGSVGNICDVIFLNNQSNFTWSLNDTILSIVMDDVVIDLEILEINDTLLLFDDNFYYNNEWSSNIPSYEEQGWSGLSFKHDSTYVIEYTHFYDPGNDVNNEMYIYQNNYIYKFCNYDPYFIINTTNESLQRLNCYVYPESLQFTIEYQNNILSIHSRYSDPDTYENKIRYYSLIE